MVNELTVKQFLIIKKIVNEHLFYDKTIRIDKILNSVIKYELKNNEEIKVSIGIPKIV
jgi:hypothetical protein